MTVSRSTVVRTCSATTHCRRFTRDADRAMLGGVFAGLARHFGFNLCVTRFLAIIAFFAAFPFMVFAYIMQVLWMAWKNASK